MQQHEVESLVTLLTSSDEANVKLGLRFLRDSFCFTQKQINVFIIDNVLPVFF